MGLLRQLCQPSGTPSLGVRNLFLGLISHTLAFWESVPKKCNESWVERRSGEILTQFFPNFPILYERAKFTRECKKQDEQAWDELCEKSFPDHVKMSPGLFLITCACPNKTVYGFSFMTKNESPGMIFELDQTRFPRDYKPTWVYDASCKAKEYGLNRDPERWMQMAIVTDPFHQPNHTSCSDTFKSTEYPDMQKLNCEAAEQFNSLLRKVHSSLAFMGPENYMLALSIMVGYQNNQCHKKIV